MQQRACEGSWTSPVRFLCNIYITCNESERCANKTTKHDGDTETLNTSTCVRFVKKKRLQNPTFLLSTSQSASAAVVRPVHVSDCVAEQPCRFTQLVRCAPGCYIHQTTRVQKKNIQPSAVKRRISLGSLRSPFLGLCFPLPPKNRNLRV